MDSEWMNAFLILSHNRQQLASIESLVNLLITIYWPSIISSDNWLLLSNSDLKQNSSHSLHIKQEILVCVKYEHSYCRHPNPIICLFTTSQTFNVLQITYVTTLLYTSAALFRCCLHISYVCILSLLTLLFFTHPKCLIVEQKLNSNFSIAFINTYHFAWSQNKFKNSLVF